MSELVCDKHKIPLECMAGEPAHRGNWYCPKCYMLDTMTDDEMVENIFKLQEQLEQKDKELRHEIDMASQCDISVGRLKAENEKLMGKYNELLMGVSNKFPNESRHETALRYIKQAETSTNQCAKVSLHKEKEG